MHGSPTRALPSRITRAATSSSHMQWRPWGGADCASASRRGPPPPTPRQLCRAVAERGRAAQLLATWCVVLLLVITGGELLASLEGPGEVAAVTEFEARMAQLQEGLGDAEKAQLQKVLDFRVSNSLCSVPSLDALSWSRGGAYYYVLTALTTIGYGTFVPATANGKVGSMLFCVPALVLFGIANTMLGGALEQLLASGVRRCRRARRQRRQRSSGGARVVVVVAAAEPERPRHEHRLRRELRGAAGEGEVAARDGGDDDDDAHEKAANAQVSSALGVVVLLLWLLLMAAFFAHSEGWSFADGLYFAFITTTTIGLGDFAPTVARDTFLSYSFILGGVTLMSVCMHSVGRLLSSWRAKAELLARRAASAAATAASHRHLGSHRNLGRDRGVMPADEGDDGGSGGGGGDADAASPTGAAAGGELGARAALGQISKALCVFALLVLAGGGMLHHIEYDEHAAAMDGYAAAVSGVCSKTASNETISSKKQFETTGGAGNCTALVFAFDLLDDKTAFCGRSTERACYTTCSRQAGSKPGQFCRAACLRDCRLFGDQLLQCSSLHEFCANPAAYGAQKTGDGRPIPGSNSSANASGTGGAGAGGAGGGGKGKTPGKGKGPLGKGRRLSKWFKPKGPKGPTDKTLAGARFPQKGAPVNETLDKVQELLATLGCPEPDVSPSANPWELLSAMMFALTIVTTIGYGSFSVQTSTGKAFVCVFAVVGIVVFSWCNMQFVEALMTMVRAEEGSYKRACQRKQRSPRAAPERPSVLLHVAFVVVLAFLFLLIGAAVLQSRDHNGDGVADGLLGAFWFLFVSTTTIGFGDYSIPGSGVGFFLLAALIILVGLALVGMALQSVTDIFEYIYKEKVALRHAAATSMQALFRGKLSQRSQDSSAPSASVLVIADITDAPSIQGPSIVV